MATVINQTTNETGMRLELVDSRSLKLVILLIASLAVANGCGKETATSPIDEVKSLVYQKKFDAAREKCNAILKVDPDNYDALVMRGDIQRRSNELDAAVEDLTRAIELYPQRPDAYDFRRQTYEKLAEIETDPTARRLLNEAEAADAISLRKYDPDPELEATYHETPIKKPSYLDKPIAGQEVDLDQYTDVELKDPLNESLTPNRGGRTQRPAEGEIAEINPRGLDDPNDPNDDPIDLDQQQTRPKRFETADNNDSTQDDDSQAEPRTPQQAQSRTAEQLLNRHKRSLEPLRAAALKSQEDEKSDEEAIEKKDLAQQGSTKDDSTDEENRDEQEVAIPKRPVTRFDLQAFEPVIRESYVIPLPSTDIPRGATTGIRPPTPEAGERLNGTPSSGIVQRGTGLRSNDLGLNGAPIPQIKSTGIRSSSQTSNPQVWGEYQRQIGAIPGAIPYQTAYPNRAMIPGQTAYSGLSGPSGFLPPDAQGAFGPRLGPPAPTMPDTPEDEPDSQRDTKKRPSALPNANNVLTTALPGTHLQAGQGVGGNKFAPDLADPSYTPFVPRKVGKPSTPTLPNNF